MQERAIWVVQSVASSWGRSSFLLVVDKFLDFADHAASLNYPLALEGLRGLQDRGKLKNLIKNVRRSLERVNWEPGNRPPLFVKISPDLSEQDKHEIARLAVQFLFDGLIVSNTTVSRPGKYFAS